jgi:hypothetical protein
MLFHDHTLKGKFPALVYAADSWDALYHENARLRHALHDARLARRQGSNLPLIASACVLVGTIAGFLVRGALS